MTHDYYLHDIMQWGTLSIFKLEEALNDTDFQVDDIVERIEELGLDIKNINNHFQIVYEMQMEKAIDKSNRVFTDNEVDTLKEVFVNDIVTSYRLDINFGTVEEMIKQIDII